MFLLLVGPNLGLSLQGTDLVKAGGSGSSRLKARQETAAKGRSASATKDSPLVADDRDFLHDGSNPLDALDAYISKKGPKPGVLYASQPSRPARRGMPRAPMIAAAPVPPTKRNALSSKQAAALLSHQQEPAADGAAEEAEIADTGGAVAPEGKTAADAADAAGKEAAPPAAAPSAAAPSGAPAAASPPENKTNGTNGTNATANATENSTEPPEPCVTRLENRVTHSWTFFAKVSPPGTPCVFGVDPRDEGSHCIGEEGDAYGSYGWCFTAADKSEWGSCSEKCPLYGHMAQLGQKIAKINHVVDDIRTALDVATTPPPVVEETEPPVLAAAPAFGPGWAAAPAFGAVGKVLAGAPAAAAGAGLIDKGHTKGLVDWLVHNHGGFPKVPAVPSPNKNR